MAGRDLAEHAAGSYGCTELVIRGPIGIFDSGVGGLSVLRDIRAALRDGGRGPA